MKKSRLLIAVLAATMFVLAAFGFVACDKDAGDILGGGGGNDPTTTTGKYTITFVYGEGTGTPATAQTTNGKLSTLPTPTAPNGKKFDAWYDAATGGTKVTTATTFTKNSSIYARYTDNGTTPGTEYTITFMVGTDGTMSLTPNYVQTTNGKLTSLPRVTANSGYTFNGWYTESTGGTAVTLETVFDKNTTLYAQYTGGVQQEGGNKVYVGNNVVATLSVGSTEGLAYDYYAENITLSAGDKLKFSLEGVTIAVVWVDAGAKLEEKGTNIDVTGNLPEVTVTEAGTYTVSIKQSEEDSTNGSNKWQIWAGIPGGGGGGDVSDDVKPIGSSGVWLVGEGIPGGGWGNGVELIQNGSVWTATVYVTNTGWLKIRNGGTSDGSGTSWVANADAGYTKYPGDDNFWVIESGTYTFSFDGEKVTVTPA
ncbi:MAG: InlB B-repeat-containing protein [Clostridiales bacterium]|nr:InlB B-repeat-containing protein [Clostridiales bacterium]